MEWFTNPSYERRCKQCGEDYFGCSCSLECRRCGEPLTIRELTKADSIGKYICECCESEGI
jgi:hypothetical protein